MSGKTVMAAAVILLGSTGLAPARFIVFPQDSYPYPGGFYSPLTGTAVGERPPYDYAPGWQRPGYPSGERGSDYNWRKWNSR
jgi:hypothetical protein